MGQIICKILSGGGVISAKVMSGDRIILLGGVDYILVLN
jgi:hypothetical protein